MCRLRRSSWWIWNDYGISLHALSIEYGAGLRCVRLERVCPGRCGVGLLAQSPQKGLELPRRESSLEYLTLDEARRLLSLAEERARTTDRAVDWSRAVAIAIALRQGLRRGEIFGLRWQDIDLASGRMSVMRSYRQTPKSGLVRHLPLHSALIPLLTDWQSRCPKTPERLVCPVQTKQDLACQDVALRTDSRSFCATLRVSPLRADFMRFVTPLHRSSSYKAETF